MTSTRKMKVVQQILLCAVMSPSPGASSQELPDHGPSTWHRVSHRRLEPAQRQELPPCDAAVLSCDASRLANDSSTCLISGEQTGSFYIRRSCQLQFNGSIVFEDAMVEAAWPEVTLQIRAQNGNVTLRDSFFWRFSKLGFHSACCDKNRQNRTSRTSTGDHLLQLQHQAARPHHQLLPTTGGASATASTSGGIFFQWDAPSGEVQKFLTVAETVLSVEPPGRWDIVLNGSRRVEFRGMQRLTLQHARDVFLASRMLVNVFDALHISANRSISTASALYCSGKIVVDGLNVAEVQLGGLVGGDLVSDGAQKPVVLVRGSAVAIAPADTWNVERIAVFASKQSTFRAVSDYYDTDVRTSGDRFMEACDAEADAESRHRRPPEDPRRAAVRHYFPWSRGATTTAAATRQASERSSPAARQHQQASPLRDDFPRDSIDYCQMWSSPCASNGSGADSSGGRSSRRVEINQRLQNEENEDAPEGRSSTTTTGNATSTCYTPTWYGDFFGDAERFPHGLADLERQFVNEYSFDFIQVAPVVQIAAKAKIQAQAMLFCADRWQVTKSTLSTSGRGCRAGQGRGRGASGRDPHLLGAGGSHSGRGGFAVRADSDAVQRVASAGMQYDIPDSEDARGQTQKKETMFSDLVSKKNFQDSSRKSGGIWWDVSAPASAGGCGDDTECSFLWRLPSRPSFGGGMIWASVRDAQLEKAVLQADGSKGMVSEGTYGQSWASGGGSGGQIVLHTLNGVLDGSSGLLSAKGGSNACLATGASGAGGGGLVGIRWHQQQKQERTGRTRGRPRPLKTATAHIQIAVDGGSIDPSCLENPPPHVHTVTERIQGHRGIASHLGMCSPGLSGTFCTPCEKGTWSGGGASCEPCDQPGGVEKFEWIAVGWTNSTCPYRCPVGYPNVDTNPSCLDPWRFTMAFFGGLFGLLTIGVVLVFLILISMSAEEYRRKRRKRQQRAAYRAEQMLLEVAAPGGSSTAEAGRGGPTTAIGLGGTTHQVRENPLGDTPTTGRFESLPRRYSPSGSSYGGRRGGIAGATAGKRKMMSFGYANNEVADRRSMARWAEIRVNVWMSATTRDVPGAVRGRGGPPRGGSASPTATDSFLGEFCPCSSYLRQVASGFRGIVRWCGRAFRRACAAVRSCGERVCLCCCKLRSRGVFRRTFRESRAGGPAEARSRAREPGEHAVSSRRAADHTPTINDHDPWFSENHDESTHDDPSIAKDVDACSSVPTSQRGSTISLPLSPAEAGSPGPLTRVLNDNLTDAHAFLSAFGHQYHLSSPTGEPNWLLVEPNWFPEAHTVHPLPHSGSSEAGAAGRGTPLLGSGSPGVVASPMLTVIPPAQSPLTTAPSGTLSLPPLAAGTSTAATPTDQLGGRGTTYGGRGPLGLNYSTSRYLGPGGSSFMPPPSTCTSASAMLTPTEHASPEQIGSASATASANNITNQVFLTEDAVRSLLFSPDDLPYHARRVYFRGTNREQDPWRLDGRRNPWRARVSDDGWRAFSEKVNTEVCVSTSSAVRVGKFLSAVYPPLVPWWRRKHRRARACRLLEFVNIELENLSLGQRLWSDVSARTSDRNLQIKFGCDGSASLAYLDFLDYDSNSLFDWSPELRENEQRFLPAAGDGSYDAPFALELTDPLLSQMQSVAGSAVLLPLLHAFNRCARAISAEDLDAAWRAYWKASSVGMNSVVSGGGPQVGSANGIQQPDHPEMSSSSSSTGSHGGGAVGGRNGPPGYYYRDAEGREHSLADLDADAFERVLRQSKKGAQAAKNVHHQHRSTPEEQKQNNSKHQRGATAVAGPRYNGGEPASDPRAERRLRVHPRFSQMQSEDDIDGSAVARDVGSLFADRSQRNLSPRSPRRDEGFPLRGAAPARITERSRDGRTTKITQEAGPATRGPRGEWGTSAPPRSRPRARLAEGANLDDELVTGVPLLQSQHQTQANEAAALRRLMHLKSVVERRREPLRLAGIAVSVVCWPDGELWSSNQLQAQTGTEGRSTHLPREAEDDDDELPIPGAVHDEEVETEQDQEREPGTTSLRQFAGRGAAASAAGANTKNLTTRSTTTRTTWRLGVLFTGCGSTSRSSAPEAGVTHDLFRTTNNGVSFNMLPGARTARPSSAIASAEGRGAHLAAQLRIPSSASIFIGEGKQHACHLAQILQRSVAFPREQILQNRTAPSWSYSPSLLILALYALIFADAMVSILLANTFFQMHPVVFLVWFLLPPLCPLAYPVQGIGWLLFARDEKGRTFCHLVAASMVNVYAGFTAWLLSVVVRSLGLLTPGGAGGGDEDGELVAVALPARLYRGVVGLFAEYYLKFPSANALPEEEEVGPTAAQIMGQGRQSRSGAASIFRDEAGSPADLSGDANPPWLIFDWNPPGRTTPSPILTDTTIADADNPFVGLRHTLLGALCFLAELGGIAVLKIALGVTANFYIGAVETEELQFDERDEEEPRRTGANFGRNMISNMNYEAGDSGDEHESRAAAPRGDGAGSR